MRPVSTPAPALSLDELTDDDRHLHALARDASTHAYAPYSGLHVGAAVRTAEGGRFSACNVENASFGMTCCAERCAIFAAVAAEGPQMRVRCLAVYAAAHTVSPCGACRQVLAEFSDDARVLFPMGDRICVTTARELLPTPFRLER